MPLKKNTHFTVLGIKWENAKSSLFLACDGPWVKHILFKSLGQYLIALE